MPTCPDSSPRFVHAINASASVSQWRTSRRISTEPPPNFNSGRDIPRHQPRSFRRDGSRDHGGVRGRENRLRRAPTEAVWAHRRSSARGSNHVPARADSRDQSSSRQQKRAAEVCESDPHDLTPKTPSGPTRIFAGLGLPLRYSPRLSSRPCAGIKANAGPRKHRRRCRSAFEWTVMLWTHSERAAVAGKPGREKPYAATSEGTTRSSPLPEPSEPPSTPFSAQALLGTAMFHLKDRTRLLKGAHRSGSRPR